MYVFLITESTPSLEREWKEMTFQLFDLGGTLRASGYFLIHTAKTFVKIQEKFPLGSDFYKGISGKASNKGFSELHRKLWMMALPFLYQFSLQVGLKSLGLWSAMPQLSWQYRKTQQNLGYPVYTWGLVVQCLTLGPINYFLTAPGRRFTLKSYSGRDDFCRAGNTDSLPPHSLLSASGRWCRSEVERRQWCLTFAVIKIGAGLWLGSFPVRFHHEMRDCS